MAPCGLPASYAQFTSAATVTTFNMTADCTINDWNVGSSAAYLWFESGATFTINGNGHSIIGPPSRSWTLFVENSTLNLNNVTLRGNSGTNNSIRVESTATLNASNVIFRNNSSVSAALVTSGQVNLNNVQFLNNQSTNSGLGGAIVVTTGAGASLVITNGIFQGNRPTGAVLHASFNSAIRLEGCMVFSSNVYRPSNTAAANYWSGVSATVTDNSSPASCPKRKKKKKAPTAVPTATPRPQIAATHVALQAATGATFRTAFGLDSGVHFRQLDGAGIGVQSIIDAGYLEAFDVYGYVEQGVEVCFPQIGRVIFLDARTMPRAIVPLSASIVDEQTCVSIDSPGSLVLLPN